MTGTASPAAAEFFELYSLKVGRVGTSVKKCGESGERPAMLAQRAANNCPAALGKAAADPGAALTPETEQPKPPP